MSKTEDTEKESLAEALIEVIEGKDDAIAISSEVNNLLSSLPRTSGFYFKVYKTKPLPQGIDRPQFKTEIMDIGTIDDLEVYIRNLAMENDWGAGEYMISTFRQDNGKKMPGLAKKPVKISIDYKRELPTSLSPNTLDSVKNVKGIMDAVKDFLPPSVQNNPQETTKMLIDMFKTGLESSKTNGNFPVVEIIKLIKESSEQRNSLEEVAVLVKNLKDIGVIKDNPQITSSPIEEILKYREFFDRLGLGGDAVSGGRKNPFMELLQIIAPVLPEIIAKITEPINKLLELKTLSLQASLPNPTKFIPAQLSPVKPLEKTTDKKEEAKEGMLPIPKELIDKGLEGYPEFYRMVYDFPQMKVFLEQFRQGLISDTQILEMLPKDLPAEMKEYLSGFLKWMKVSISDMGSALEGICNKCGESYEYASKDAYEQDNKVCDAEKFGQTCEGQIELKENKPEEKIEEKWKQKISQ